MTVGARSLNPFRVLKTHRNFRLFWIGQTLSLIGSWMQTMALGWLALELSNSALVVGLVASVGAIPIVLLSMHAGAFVDRSDRLRLVRITQSIFLAEAVILWGVTRLGVVTIPILLLMAVIQGCCSAVEIPARQSMIIQLVGRDDLQPAIALNSSGFNLARIVGPAIGGVVIHHLGIGWCFGLNAISYLAVLWGLLLIRLPIALDAHPSLGFADTLRDATRNAADGVRHLMQRGPVRDLLALVTVGAVVAGPFLTLMPVMARDRLHLGADGYGGLLTSVGIGGLIGALAVAGPASHWRRGRTLTVTSLLFPIFLLAFACTTTTWAASALLVMTGVAMIIFNALANGVLQTLVAESYRGRLMALYSLLYVGMSQAVGALLVGGLARVIGVAPAIGVCAVATLAFATWTARTSRLRAL
jgi:MFS family permease